MGCGGGVLTFRDATIDDVYLRYVYVFFRIFVNTLYM
jgi:hypothetical protein